MNPRICIFGAGSIGCYVGGRLAAAGADVVFVGRERLGRVISTHGLQLSDHLGAQIAVAADEIVFSTEAELASDAGLILVCVKSAATLESAAALAPHVGRNQIVVSLQNGIGNAAALRAGLVKGPVLSGMVPFNVINRGHGHFHQGTSGELDVQADAVLEPFAPAFRAAGLPLNLHADMNAVLWSKLLLNLNNAVNALSGVPLKVELSQRDFRRVLARLQQETLELLSLAGIVPARLSPVPPRWLPMILRAPDWLFSRLARAMLAIDPLARSSMWEDLEAGRRTEVNYLNGEVVALARRLERDAPANAAIVKLVRAAEDGGRRDWAANELLNALDTAA